MVWTREQCEELDRTDPIGWVRERFVLPDGVVYLDGNSLGALPASLRRRMDEVVAEQWGRGLIGSWSGAGWLEAPRRIGDKIARLIGARSGEVIACDSTTVALTKLLVAALAARPGRRVLLTTSGNFPSDLYAAAGIGALTGRAVVKVVEPDCLPAELATGEVAVLFLTHVDFRTGAMFDLEKLTKAAHDAGALALWDLCHSAGAVLLDCEGAGVDLALGCGYKYLNGGPGAPAFLYVRHEHQGSLTNPLPGWLGHEDPFAFEATFRPSKEISGFLTSSPPVLGLTALEAGVDTFEGVAMEDVRAKSVQLGQLFAKVVEEHAGAAADITSPLEPALRGSQVCLRHRAAGSIVSALAASGVVGDFRPPDICRFGFAPLYLTHVQVCDAARAVAWRLLQASG